MNATWYHSNDCSGNHDVMARQVRPWRTEPDWLKAPLARHIDGGVRQHIPSGTEAKPLLKSGCMAAIYVLLAVIHEGLCKQGRPCMSHDYL